MHRTVIEACLPCVLALVISLGLLTLLVRNFCARCDWNRFWQTHNCESGGVQSLSLVLTLPIFVTIILFIVQVSQLMLGTMVVNYAAFAAARSAAVWLPADIGTSDVERENVVDANVSQQGDLLYVTTPQASPSSVKFQKILAAAVFACAPISPSRDLVSNTSLPVWLTQAQDVTATLYPHIVPTSQTNPRITARVDNKLAYSYLNTSVVVSWQEVRHPGKDVEQSPTYNPRNHPDPDVSRFHWDEREVGWQDPVTVTVLHDFALLPGPGRFLAKQIVPADGSTDLVAPRINTVQGQYSETVYTTRITASATLVNEGLKSVVPYVQP